MSSLPFVPGNQCCSFCVCDFEYSSTSDCGIIQYVSLCIWLISPSVMSSSFIHTVAGDIYVAILSIYLYVYIYVYILFIHPPIGGYMAGFHLLAIVNNTAMNVDVQISFETLLVFEPMLTTGMAGSPGSFSLNFLTNCHIVFHIQSPQECRGIPFSLYPHRYLLFSLSLFVL